MSSKEILIRKSHLTPTVLIAGSGFLGSHLIEKLLLQDVRVVVVESVSPNKDSFLKNVQKNPKFVFFDADINDGIPEKIKSADYVIAFSQDATLSNTFGIKNLLELAKKSDAKFLLVSNLNNTASEAQRFAEALTQEFYDKQALNARIVRLPIVYGPRMELGNAGILGQVLDNSIHHKDIVLDGDGTEKSSYLYVTDAVSGLTKSLFSANTEGEVFSLVSDEDNTALEIAFLVKGLADAGLKVRFTGKDKSKTHAPADLDIKNLKHLNWEPKVGLKEGLIKTMLWFGYTPNEHGFKPAKLIEEKRREKIKARSEQIVTLAGLVDEVVEEVKQSVESISESPHIPKIKTSKPLKFPKLAFPALPLSWSKTAILAAIVAVVVFPALLTSVYSAAGASNLKKTSNSLLSLNSETARKHSNNAFKNFSLAENSLTLSKWAFQVLGKSEAYNSYGNLLSSLKYFSKASYDATKATQPFSNLFEAVKPNSSVTLDAEGFRNSALLLAQSKTNFNRAYGDFKSVDINQLPKFVSSKLEAYEYGLAAALNYVDTAATFSDQIPNLLGVGGTKTYLILFQNSNEMRPTGGFIGSYSLVEVQNGKVSSIIIDDIYNPDGQIDVRDIQVTPPTVLAEALDEDRLYIRNANWDPDFVKSAETIRALYFRVTGKNVDGVLAVDLGFVQGMLDVTGPFYLTTFGEEISSSNLYERAQFHSEFNFEAGSDQKRQFLTVLGGKLLESLFSLPQERVPNLISAVEKSLVEKHLLISLPGNPLSAELSRQGWDGSLVKTAGDYLYVVNANIGGTKANYFVENEIRYQVSSQTRDGLLRAKLTLNYKHTGTDNDWPGGPYKNYVRVLTQSGARLTNATLGAPGTAGTSIMENMAIGNESGYVSFEHPIEIAPQEEVSLTLYYDLPANLSITKENKNYHLYWQKQPGTSADPISFTFEPPFGTQAEQETHVQTLLNTDRTFSISVR